MTVGQVRVVVSVLSDLLPTADDTEVQGWTCGYRGLCRKHCYAQEYMIGYRGCPRRYSRRTDLNRMSN
ncbi:defensin, beta-like [Pimephales promelas]|nr:defensin, beta-like [Pimephales promelas]